MARIRSRRRERPNFPWVLLLILLGSIYLFWIYPRQKPAPSPTLDGVLISQSKPR